jgi:CheY-like chemotaxis protein
MPLIALAGKVPSKHKLALRRAAGASAAVRILIVDDSPINCKLLQRTFKQAAKRRGVTIPVIVTASNGQIAVNMVAASLALPNIDDLERGSSTQPALFDLICLDRQMPVCDGVEAARKIKALQDGYFLSPNEMVRSFSADQMAKPAYIVGMSASIENPSDWIAAGVDEMLPKPFTADDIEELLLAMCPGSLVQSSPPSPLVGQVVVSS